MPDRSHQAPIHRADLWKFKFVIEPKSDKVVAIRRRRRYDEFKILGGTLLIGAVLLGVYWLVMVALPWVKEF